MRVLVVDDHPILHEVLGAVARSVFRDAQVCFAKSLDEAFECARDGETLDLVLPGCAGLDALSAFRGRFPAVRTIVVSATEDRASVLRALVPRTSRCATV